MPKTINAAGRIALALVPGSVASVFAMLDDRLGLGGAGEVAAPIAFLVALGACVLAPFIASDRFRRLRIAGLILTPIVINPALLAILELIPDGNDYLEAGAFTFAFVAGISGLTLALASRRTTGRFYLSTALLLLLAITTVCSAWFGFAACFLSGCSTLEEFAMYAGIGSILYLLPAAFALVLHFHTAPKLQGQ